MKAQARAAATPKETPKPETDRFARWREDPVAFALEVLGIRLWPKQEEILRTIAFNRKVAVRSGQKCGKSIVAAVAALWFVCCFPGAYVILTAPSGRQVRIVLWKELRRLYLGAKIPIGGKLNKTPSGGLVFDDGRAIIGMSTDKPERMAGPSGANLFYVVDEASGFADAIFEAIQGNTSGGGRIILFSNPTKNHGFFFQTFHRKRQFWKLLEITSVEASKYANDFPGLMLPGDVAEAKADHGEESTWYLVRVLGQFPKQGDDTIIGLDIIDAAVERWLERFDLEREAAEAIVRDRERHGEILLHPALGPLDVGVDVARFGDDETVITPRRGKVAAPAFVVRGYDSNQVAAAVIAIIKQHRAPHEKATVKVDGIGYGAAVVDRLRQRKFVLEDGSELSPSDYCSVIDINVAEVADDEEAFPNLRSQLWFGIRDWLKDGGEMAPDPKAESELLAPIYKFDARGRRQVQSKDEIKKEIGRSPDRADSMGLMVYGRRRPERKRERRAAGGGSRFGSDRGF